MNERSISVVSEGHEPSRAQSLRSSFRDPSGFLFHGDDGQLYRQVNRCYLQDFELLHQSKLYDELTKRGQLVEHEVVDVRPITSDGVQVIRPRKLAFISYPYEWSFSALQDAALLTLDIQIRALKHDLQLKDATAYNVQFDGCRAILIDTLSFERYATDKPWIAYGQFCRHFLAPLALMAKTHIDCGYFLRDYIDGIPLDLASRMLPFSTRMSLGMQLHLHWHAKMVARHSATGGDTSQSKTREVKMPKSRLLVYLENLRKTVSSLEWSAGKTTWGDYYDDNSYSKDAFREKEDLVRRYLQTAQPKTVWDLGANTGVFSRLASGMGAYTCAFDIDPACVERAYTEGKKAKLANFLPLRMDLTNPSPAIGWAHTERDSLADRGPADLAMALALIHHLAIANNVPLPAVADYFRRVGKHLIIEFVPKGDPQVNRLLQHREDIFDSYHQAGFEEAFRKHYDILESQSVGTDGRVLYLMRSR